jgi:hypothetical protein
MRLKNDVPKETRQKAYESYGNNMGNIWQNIWYPKKKYKTF